MEEGFAVKSLPSFLCVIPKGQKSKNSAFYENMNLRKSHKIEGSGEPFEN